MIRISTDLTTWTLFEKIRLLELFMNKEILWEGRAEILQNEFAQRPHNFFTVQNIRQELHQIFVTPNPEHVYGLPLHPRGKEAAEMWLKYFRKELTKQRELQKQMFAISMRRHLDLIKRFQQGKLPPQEIEAILTEARERDAQRPDRELYETKLKEMLDKIQLDSLDNIRTFSDYCSYLRGEKITTPPPEPVEEAFPKSPSLVRLKSPLLHSPELVLKEKYEINEYVKVNKPQSKLEKAVQKIMSLSNRQNLMTKPCKIEQKSQLNQNINKHGVKDLMKINTFQTLDTTLKNSDIKNNTIQTQEQRASTNDVNQRTTTITCVGNARQNDEFPILDDFSLLEDDESDEEINEVEFSSSKSKQFSTVNNQGKEEHLNKFVNTKLIQEDNEAKNSFKKQNEKLIDEEECKKSIKYNEAIEEEDILKTVDDDEICGGNISEYNDDIMIRKQNIENKNDRKEINGDRINRNIFEEEEDDEIMNDIETGDNDVVVLNTDEEEEEVRSVKEDDIKVIEEAPKEEGNDDKNINAVENPEVIVVEDDEIIVDFVKINKEESVLGEEENVLIEKEMEKSFQESFIDANLEFGNVSIEEKVAEIVLKHSNMEYAKLASSEATLERINQSLQLIKMYGQEKDIFVECVLKIVQCASVEEKVIVPPLPITNSLEEPMTSTKAAQINALEAELIEPTQPSKQQQPSRRRRQKSTSQKAKLPKTQLKMPQQLPAIKTAALPPPPRNLRSSTAKKIIEEEMEAPIPKTDEEEIKTVAVEELAPTVASIGSRKRKRNVTEFLKPPQTDINDQQHGEDEGPPAKNLRRSSHSSPSSQTFEPKTSTESKKALKQPDSASLIPEISSVKEKAEAPIKIEQEQPIMPIKTPPPPPLQLSTPTLHSHVAATAKLRSSLRRAALASATPSPAVDSVGTNGLFLRPGNHSSSEVIPKEVLLTLWKDIRTHRHSYVFDQPVDEGEVPGYHSAIKKPMDLNTLFQLIESFTIQTFGQFTHHILKIFANAVMYNSTGHHVNTCAKEMLAYALKCIEVVQYPSGQWSAGIFSTPIFGTSSNCQSIASESDCPFDGQLSRSSSGISCSQAASTSNAAKTSTQQKLLRSSSISKRETSKTKAIPSSASSTTSSHSETKKETEYDKQISNVPKNETLPKKRRLHRTR